MQDMIKFTVVLVCFIIALCNRRLAAGRADNRLLVAGLLLTLVSDFFLVLMGMNKIGLFVFCFVHVLYIARHSGARKGLLWLLLTIVPAAVLWYFTGREMLVFLGGIYAQCFAVSLGAAVYCFVKKRYPFPNNFLILFGMVLFMLCDINVALYNMKYLGVAGGMYDKISAGAFSLIWLFYAPSQLFIALSGKAFTKIVDLT